MAITSTLTTSFKKELLEAVHNFKNSGGDTFKLALYTSSATLGATTTAFTTTGQASGTNYTSGGANLTRVDPTSRSILAQIEVLNPRLELIPGILLNIKVIYDQRKSLSIPEESLIIQGDNKFVYLIDNNVLKRQNIKIGLRNFGKVEVLSGLEIGDKIVAEGTNKVRNKAKVKIKK